MSICILLPAVKLAESVGGGDGIEVVCDDVETALLELWTDKVVGDEQHLSRCICMRN